MVSNKQKVEEYFNKWVKPRSFRVGDLVLKQIGVTTQEEGKLEQRWVSPYVVTTVNRPSSYSLKDSQGVKLPYPWKAEHMKKYFV